jgi:hypothetical protein
MNTMEFSPQTNALSRAKSRVATYTEKLEQARRELAEAERAHRAAIVADLAGGAPSDVIGERHGVSGSRVRQIRAAELNRRAAS